MRRFLSIVVLSLVFLLALPLAAAPRAIKAQPFGVSASAPATIENDDSCDIGVFPAATLLLPYFEVDLASPQQIAQTTLFTVTNVTPEPQIVHITIWTDWSFPILDFNVFLTGYDVQPINLWDVLAQGRVAPGPGFGGTSSTGDERSPLGDGVEGAIPLDNDQNPNISAGAVAEGGICSDLPGVLPPQLMAAVRTALTTGVYNPGFAQFPGCGARLIGSNHGTNAIGYVTMDVAATCSVNLPDNPIYFQTEILFDNALTGDYQQINPNPSTGNFAQANPMVHIRAIPEGGPSGSVQSTNLPYTFYARYNSFFLPGIDRRQPLPATFAARWIDGGPGGYQTAYKIWREGVTAGVQSCNTAVNNSDLAVTSIIRFDEHENSFGFGGGRICSPCPEEEVGFPETSRTMIDDEEHFPPVDTEDLGGWTYLNLDHDGFVGRASQNWVIVSMSAEGRYSVDFDATQMGNGCTPPIAAPSETDPVAPPSPAP